MEEWADAAPQRAAAPSPYRRYFPPASTHVHWVDLYEYEVARTAYSIAKLLEFVVIEANPGFDLRDQGRWDGNHGNMAPTLNSSLARVFKRHSEEILGPGVCDIPGLQVGEGEGVMGSEGYAGEEGTEGGHSVDGSEPGSGPVFAAVGHGSGAVLESSIEFQMRNRIFELGATESKLIKALSLVGRAIPSDTRRYSYRSLAALLYAFALTQQHDLPVIAAVERRVSLWGGGQHDICSLRSVVFLSHCC